MKQQETRRSTGAVGEWLAWHAELVVLGVAGTALFVAWSVFHWGIR